MTDIPFEELDFRYLFERVLKRCGLRPLIFNETHFELTDFFHPEYLNFCLKGEYFEPGFRVVVEPHRIRFWIDRLEACPEFHLAATREELGAMEQEILDLLSQPWQVIHQGSKTTLNVCNSQGEVLHRYVQRSGWPIHVLFPKRKGDYPPLFSIQET